VPPDGFFDIQILQNSFSAAGLCPGSHWGSLQRSPLVGWEGIPTPIPHPLDAFDTSVPILSVGNGHGHWSSSTFVHAAGSNAQRRAIRVRRRQRLLITAR